MEKPIIIDFVGKPGAGKTFTKNQVMKYLSAEYKCFDFSDSRITTKDYLLFIITSPKSFVASLSLIILNVPRSYKKMLKLLRKWVGSQVKIKKAKSGNYDFALNDEGLFIWMQWIKGSSLKKFHFESIPESRKKSFLYPDITIFVKTDFDLSETRRINRDSAKKSKKKLKRKSEQSASKFLQYIENDLKSAEIDGYFKVIYYKNQTNFDSSLVNKIKIEQNKL